MFAEASDFQLRLLAKPGERTYGGTVTPEEV
jgi:hypothetical protein